MKLSDYNYTFINTDWNLEIPEPIETPKLPKKEYINKECKSNNPEYIKQYKKEYYKKNINIYKERNKELNERWNAIRKMAKFEI